jgi:hypothetical protein
LYRRASTNHFTFPHALPGFCNGDLQFSEHRPANAVPALAPASFPMQVWPEPWWHFLGSALLLDPRLILQIKRSLSPRFLDTCIPGSNFKMFLKISVVAAIAALVNAAPAPVKHVLHEERSMPSRDWVKGARIEKNAVIPMRIGLTQTNLEKGYDYLMEV